MWLMPGRNPRAVNRLMNPPQMSGLGNHIYFIHIAYRALDAGDRVYGIVQSRPVIHRKMPIGAVRHQHLAGYRRSRLLSKTPCLRVMRKKYHPAPPLRLLAPDRPPDPDSTGTL